MSPLRRPNCFLCSFPPQELLELVNNREYCKAVLGCDELDWSLLERHFNRSQNALRKKYWMLSKAQQAAGAWLVCWLGGG